MATTPVRTPPTQRTVRIDLLALDLSTCGRCTRTGANLDEALRVASDRLRARGVAAQVTKTVVASEDQAARLRFESSPTIRVDGRDIAMELRESDCGDCGELCGCDEGVVCRVWVWEGREHLEAPVPMIVDAILQAVERPPAPASAGSGAFRLPDNLAQFFRKRDGKAASETGCCGFPADKPCCSPSDR